MRKFLLITFSILLVFGLIGMCRTCETPSNPKVQSILDEYPKANPEIKWIVLDGNNAYIGWSKPPAEYKEVCRAIALRANKATDFGFHVWAFDSSKVSKDNIQRAIDSGKCLYETTARYGRIEY